MSKENLRPTLQEPDRKRRKIEYSSSRSIQPHGTMTSTQESEVQLELTELESKLRQLLLDVATYIDQTPADTSATAVQVPEELTDEKIVLRWTGGWVRDKLLNVQSHDIDLAINKMTGEHFGLKMQEYLEIPGNAEKYGLAQKSDKSGSRDKSKKIAPGLHKIEANPEKSKNLETATTKIMGIDLDLVNLRKETYNEMSRNPQMEFGTAEEDAMRRDATVNAMFYNLHTCQVEDFTGRGHDDMAAKIIRTPLEPSQTFKDDPLRILRLIRFASRLGYTIEPETARAMADPAIQDVLKLKISRERVGIELEKMLRGSRPRMALELIDSFGLYRTVFTDPTRQLPSEAETDYFKPAYDLVESILQSNENSSIPDIVPNTLLRDDDDRYLAWICATLLPWADAPTVPHHKPTQRPFFAAYLVAREGFKAPNKVCDVIAASLSNGEEIRKVVAKCAKGLRRPDTPNAVQESTARDTLGMALRRWGSTWRTQVFFNLIYEIVLSQGSREGLLSWAATKIGIDMCTELIRSYAVFLAHISELNILDADTFKPLLKGTDLAKALNVKPGPWMKDALDVVMAWQLRNPDSTDTAAIIEAVKASRSEQSDSELPSRLALHFIELTIPPLFLQNKLPTSPSGAPYEPAPWKEPAAHYVLDLLKWSIGVLPRKEIELKWHLLVPPILKMIDDHDIRWKAKGCELLKSLLQSLREQAVDNQSTKAARASQTSADFLYRTGYHNVFGETLFGLFTYLPSLTPESESMTLLSEVFPATITLALLLPDDVTKNHGRNYFLDRIMREGILMPLAHSPTPSTYPELAALIMLHLQRLLSHMEIESVKHLPSVISLLAAILGEPFVLSHKPLIQSTLQALQAAMLNGWPRIPRHRGSIMMGLCLCWERCVEEEKTAKGSGVDQVKQDLQESFAMLNAVMQAVGEDTLREQWETEKSDMTGASPLHAGLLSGT